MAWIKKESNEQIISTDHMDAAVCAKFKGKLDEFGRCIMNMEEKEDGTMVLKPIKYQSMRQQTRQAPMME